MQNFPNSNNVRIQIIQNFVKKRVKLFCNFTCPLFLMQQPWKLHVWYSGNLRIITYFYSANFCNFKVTNVLDLSFSRNHGNLLNRITSRKKFFLDLRFLCWYKLFGQKLSSRHFGYPGSLSFFRCFIERNVVSVRGKKEAWPHVFFVCPSYRSETLDVDQLALNLVLTTNKRFWHRLVRSAKSVLCCLMVEENFSWKQLHPF